MSPRAPVNSIRVDRQGKRIVWEMDAEGAEYVGVLLSDQYPDLAWEDGRDLLNAAAELTGEAP